MPVVAVVFRHEVGKNLFQVFDSLFVAFPTVPHDGSTERGELVIYVEQDVIFFFRHPSSPVRISSLCHLPYRSLAGVP